MMHDVRNGCKAALKIQSGQLLDLLQLQEILLRLNKDDDGHVADEDGAGLLDDVNDFRLVDKLTDEVKQGEKCGGAAEEDRQLGIRRRPGDVQETNQKISAC